MAIRPA